MSNDDSRNVIAELHRIWSDDDITCKEKIKKARKLVDPDFSFGNLRHISRIIEDCAAEEIEDCLALVVDVVEHVNILPQDLESGLRAISDEDIGAVSAFIEDQLDQVDRKARLAATIPYFYRDHEDNFVDQFQSWYEKDEWFFYTASELTLKQYQYDSTERADDEFERELETVLEGIESIAEDEGLDPEDAYRSKNWKVTKAHALLEDIRWTDRYIDFDLVERNVEDYPVLHEFLDERNWLRQLRDQNRPPLAEFLSHSFQRDDFEALVRNRDQFDLSREDEVELDKSIRFMKILGFYDHCLEVIDMNAGGVSTLRDHLLERDEFYNGMAELQVLNGLMREFGTDSVEIEPEVRLSDKDDDEDYEYKTGDAKIKLGGATIYTEITNPQADIEAALNGVYSIDQFDDFPVRTYVTRKLRGQISPIKEATGDLTMLVIKNEPSKVDDWTVRGYVLGPETAIIPDDALEETEEDEEVPVVVVRDDPILDEDEITDDLDILVNFRDAPDWTMEPCIVGQVFGLNEDVKLDTLRRIGHAFNAGIEIYRTSRSES